MKTPGEEPICLTDPTLHERIEAAGVPRPDFAAVPPDQAWLVWMRTWYGFRDDFAGRTARAFLETELQPLQLAYMLENFPWRYATDGQDLHWKKQTFLDLYFLWIAYLNRGGE